MRAHTILLCVSLLISSCTGQVQGGFAINPIRAGPGATTGGTVDAGMGGGVVQSGGVVDRSMTSATGMDMSAGGTESMGMSGEMSAPAGIADIARGVIDPNLVDGRVDRSFPSETGMMTSDIMNVGMGGGTEMGVGMDTAGGGVGTGFGGAGAFDASADAAAGMGFDANVAGDTGMGFDATGGTGTGFDTSGGAGMGFDTTGDAGMGFDTASGTGVGFDSTGGGAMGFDVTGGADSGMPGLDMQGGAAMGFDAQGTGVTNTGMGMDMGAQGAAGMDTSMTGADSADIALARQGGTSGAAVADATGSQGAVEAGVPDRVRLETGPQEPGRREANEAATLLRGLMMDTSKFDAASEPTAPGAVEHHSMIAGPPGDAGGFTDTQPIVTGDMPTGAVIRTTKEEKSTFSVSGESSFEHFSSSGTGPGSSGINTVDLNPVAAGANVLDAGRGMKDFQGEGAAATAVDASRTDAAAAGVDRSATGTIDASATGPAGGTVDVKATGAWETGMVGSGTESGTAEGSATKGLDMTATGVDGTTAEIKVVGTKEAGITGDTGTGTGAAERTAGGVVDLSVTGSQGGTADFIGGIKRHETVSGETGGGIEGTGTVIGAGRFGIEDTGIAGIDVVGAGRRETSLAGDFGAGTGADVFMGSETGVSGDTGVGMGSDAGFVGTDTGVSGDIGAGMAGDAGFTEMGTGVAGDFNGMGGDLGTGVSDTGFTGMGAGEASVVLPDGRVQDTGMVPADRSVVGTIDASATGPIGTAEISATGRRDTTITGDAGTGFDGTGTVSGTADLSLIGDSGASVDASMTGRRETTVTGGAADVGAVAGGKTIATGEAAAEAPGSVNINLQDRQGVIADIKTTGTVDIKLEGPGGTAAEIHTGGTTDTGGRVGETQKVTAGEFVVSATGRDGGRADVTGRRDVAVTGIAKTTGDLSAGVDAGFGVEGGMETGVVGAERASVGVVDISASGPGGASADIKAAGVGDTTVTGDVSAGAGVIDQTRVGVVDGTVTGADGGTVDFTGAGRRDTTVTGEAGTDLVGTGSVSGAADLSFTGEGGRTIDMAGTGTRETSISGDRGTSSGVVDLSATGQGGFVADGSRADRRVLDALSTISGQMEGTAGTGSSFTVDTQGTGAFDSRANVLDKERGFRDFPSGGAASTVRETRRTDTGTSGGIFGWTGESTGSTDSVRTGGTGDLSMTGERSGIITVAGGGVRGDGSMTMEGTRGTTVTGEISGGSTGQGGGTVSFDRSGTISATGSRGDASFGIDGSRTTSVTGDRFGIVGGGVDGSASFDRSGQITGTETTGDGSMSFEGSRSTPVTGERQDGSLSFGGTRAGTGSVSFEGTGGMSGTGSFEGSVSGGVAGGAIGEAGAAVNGGKGSAMLSLEERTVRQGEWSATWNYEGAVPEWFRHRVNPAPCRHHGCNLASCYVPHPRDCKSYIVCQRTALGTYVATRMRCAFGTVWAPSNLWTCARITAQTICPNDPCRDPQLSRYPDEDFQNCKIFWKCVNGRSLPECCPPGQRFHRIRLTCVDDPDETCREPCPLKQERCSLEGPTKQPHYDGNCKTYWDCGADGAPHPVCCPDGHSFDPPTGTCIQSGCMDKCPPEYKSDVCGKVGASGKIVTAYPMKDNCRTFIKCDPKKGRIASCCRADHFYNSKTMKCEKILDHLDPCRLAICPDGYHEECRFEVVANPRKMYDIDAGIVRDCAGGTVFDKNICTCVFSNEPFKKVCKKEVDVKFDHVNDKWSVHNYGDGWISTYGAMTKNVTANNNHFATFDGTMGMEVFRYDHNMFQEFTLKLTFQPASEMAANGNKKQIIASNCRTTEVNGGPSFEVTLDPVTSMITFTGRTDTETSVVEMQYNKQGWNTYTLLFDGENVLAMIEDPNALGKADSSSTRLKGALLRGMGPLVFGPCKDNRSNPKNDGFVGFMSEVIFAKCLDEASRMFMSETLETTLGPGM